MNIFAVIHATSFAVPIYNQNCIMSVDYSFEVLIQFRNEVWAEICPVPVTFISYMTSLEAGMGSDNYIGIIFFFFS